MKLCIAQSMFVFEITKTLPRNLKIFLQTDFGIHHYYVYQLFGVENRVSVETVFLKRFV